MPTMPDIIFSTPRLVARHIGHADLADMLEVYGDEDAMRWVGDGKAITREEAVGWLEVTADNYRRRGYGMSALVWRESGETVGFCGLVHPDGQPEAEIKYALKRGYWGRGIATEAAAAMLDYGRRYHGLGYIIATTDPDNVASHRVLLKAGMTRGPLVIEDDGSGTQVFEWHAT
jgi:RimJ/RimL family protein N-acetyltransferase